MNYKMQIIDGTKSVWYDNDGVRVVFVDPMPGNREYEAYLAWLAAGNEPEIV